MLVLELHIWLSDCPLDLTSFNFTLVASVFSNKTDRAKCCRYMNAFVAVSVARVDNASALELASCFFNVAELSVAPELSPSSLSPEYPPSPILADSPSNDDLVLSPSKSHHSYHLTVVPTIGSLKDHPPAKVWDIHTQDMRAPFVLFL